MTFCRFRWAFVQLNSLSKYRSAKAIRSALGALPKTFDEIYSRMLMNIDRASIHEALSALNWLSCSRRPLTVSELAEAAILRPESSSPLDPESRFMDPNAVLEILGSLVSISSDTIQYGNAYWDHREGRDVEHVSFSHFTVKEYLQSSRSGPTSEYAMSDESSNLFVATSCLVYILSYSESSDKTGTPDDLERFPLMLYASQFWYQHTGLSRWSSTSEWPLWDLISKLFSSEAAFSTWLQIHKPDDPGLPPFAAVEKQLSSPLYYASFLGLTETVRSLLSTADVREKTADGLTALHGAAWSGSVDAALLLLDNGVDLEAKSASGETALTVAATRGHDTLVELLLKRGADAESRNFHQRTALHLATLEGHSRIVGIFAEAVMAGINLKDYQGRTALHLAAVTGREGIATYLLDKGADVQEKDSRSRSLLHLAAIDEELSLEVDITGKVSLMKMFLNMGLDMDARDHSGRTPLHYAAICGSADMISLLSSPGNVNAKDSSGSTALHLAIENDQEAAQNLLIELGADLDIENNQHQSAMNLAWSKKALNWSAYKKDGKLKIRQGAQAECFAMKKVRADERGPEVMDIIVRLYEND
jgi:ankyrin repeat protein